jgi:AIPR protein
MAVFRDASLTPVGADTLQQLYHETKNSISREFLFPNRTPIPDVAGVKEAYLGFLAAQTFLSIIEDDDGEIIKSIFYDNVRDWQGDSPGHVNTEISATVRSDHKDRFVLMNNGVTIIARSLQVTGHKCSIEDFQIVNGCQTSHALVRNEDAVDDTVMIPLRLISTQDESVIESIIRATNRQTEVKKEQFFAVTEFAKQLERFFQAFPDEHRLYYERRSRQYDSQPVEKTRVVVPQNIIRAFAAMFLAEPHRTARSYKLLDAQVGSSIFAEGHKLDPYYTSAFALYKLECMFRNQRIDRGYRNSRFQILLAARLIHDRGTLPRMNSREIERYCASLNNVLWNSVEADKLFTRAARTVHKAAKGNLERDNIHTQRFTEDLMEELLGASRPGRQKKR